MNRLIVAAELRQSFRGEAVVVHITKSSPGLARLGPSNKGFVMGS
jgi:hypothetical protein